MEKWNGSEAFSDESVHENSSFFENRGKDINSVDEKKSYDLVFMSDHKPWATSTRQKIEKLQNHFAAFSMKDMGSLKVDTHEFPVSPMLNLHNAGSVTFTLGGNLALALELAKQTGKKLTIISNSIPIQEVPGESVSLIGFQRHLCSFQSLKFADEFCPDSLSLGKMKSHPHLLEPILRDTEILYIHGNVLRNGEQMFIPSAWPTGIYSEELCQIIKHAGSSLRLTSVILDMEADSTSNHENVSSLSAELFWYLLEGMKMKETDHPALHNHLSEYVVNIAEYDAELVFLRSNLSQRWWLRLHDKEEYPYLSCAHEEYQQTIQSEVPDRLLRHISL